MTFKKKLTSILATSTFFMPLTGCATVKLGYHGLMYKMGDYKDYIDTRISQSDEVRVYDKDLLSRAKLEKVQNGENFIYVLHVQGTPYERGKQHGLLLKEQVREDVSFVNHLSEMFKAILERDINKLNNDLTVVEENERLKIEKKISSKLEELHFLEHGYELLEPFISEHFKEEMKGLADGAGVSLEAIHFYHAVGDIVESGCSNYVLGRDATANQEMIQVRILDFPLAMKVQKNSLITIAKPDKGNSFINIGWAGYIGTVTGLNDKKIILGEMRGDNAVKSYFKHHEGEMSETLQGIPMPFLLRDILQFDSSLDELTERISEAKRTNAYVYVMSDGKTQEARAFVTDQKLFKVYNADDFQEVLSIVEPDTEFRHIDDVIFGGHNNSLINDKIRDNYGRITEEMIKQDFNKALAMKDNLQIAIINSTNMTVQLANANGTEGETAKASNQNYLFLDLNEALNWFNQEH